MNLLATFKVERQNLVGLRQAVMAQKMMIGDWVLEIPNEPQPPIKEMLVDLLSASLSELGFDDGAKLDFIYSRMTRDFKFEVLPGIVGLELGFKLRLLYKSQLNGERAIICTKPILDKGGHSGLICLGRNDPVLWIGAAHPDLCYPAKSQWIFLNSYSP